MKGGTFVANRVSAVLHKLFCMHQAQRAQRHKRIRARVIGTPERPRLAVYRSNRYIYAQIIDDTVGRTLVAMSDLMKLEGTQGRSQKKEVTKEGSRRIAHARVVGEGIGVLAQKKGITKVVFDRGGFLYAGRVKVLADAARASGLSF